MFSVIITLISIITIYGTLINSNSNSSRIKQIIKCFSVTNNIRILFTLKEHKTENDRPKLSFINGIRVISTLWILIAHTYLYIPVFHKKEIPKFAGKSTSFLQEFLYFHT